MPTTWQSVAEKDYLCIRFRKIIANGALTKRLCDGLQNRIERFDSATHLTRKVGRVIDRAGLEIRYTPFGYRGFESLTFRKARIKSGVNHSLLFSITSVSTTTRGYLIKKKGNLSISPSGDSGGIQTHNLLIRSQMLYSVELRNLPLLHF